MTRKLWNLLASLAFVAAAHAQPTGFTYQGELRQGGVAANGTFDIRFALYNALSGGAQVGTAQCVDNVQVVDGRFTTTIDFGQQFATGAPRFLQIESRADTGLGCTTTSGFTVLSPRQAITTAPIANHAKSAFTLAAADGSPTNAVYVDAAGNVGIGTTSPTSTLHAFGNLAGLRLQDDGNATSSFFFEDSQASQARVLKFTNAGQSLIDINPMPLDGTGNANVRFFRETDTTGSKSVIFHSGNNSTATSAVIGVGGSSSVFQLDGGNFGIGTATPIGTVHIAATLEPTLVLQDTGSALTQLGYVGYRDSTGYQSAWVGFGTAGSPHFTVQNRRTSGNIVIDPGPGGVVQVPVLEITGADLAEKFPASEHLEPGTVVAIDRNNVGKLCMSRGAYNRCVAGVVSGANNFSVGAVLGNLPGQEDAPAIALSGRVYVLCDATDNAIEPGDLLTTSDTPGHAMKATDPTRSHGTVIGKAMEPLKAGERGLVLVLVNLQ